MKKIRIGMEILTYLVANPRKISATEITKYINDTYDTKEVKLRTVLEYLREISKEYSYLAGGTSLQMIKSARGKDGGWYVTNEGRKAIKELAINSFNSDTLNAINDSLERAMISETFYYKKDLSQAKGILYSKKNFYESDHEHYVGNGKEIVSSFIVKKIKQAAKEDKYAKFTFKYKRYSINSLKMTLKPLRLIHDLDESFLVCSKKDNDEQMYINLRNIKDIEITNKNFIRKYEKSFSQSLNEDRSSIAPRTEQWVTLKILDKLAYQVIDLWVHGCKFDINKKTNIVKATSHEHYRLMIFLFRMIGLAEIIDAHEMILRRWEEKVKNIK